jgi:hypothetical protein
MLMAEPVTKCGHLGDSTASWKKPVMLKPVLRKPGVLELVQKHDHRAVVYGRDLTGQSPRGLFLGRR